MHGRLEIAWAAGRVDCHDQEVDSDLELATVIDTAHRQGRLLDAAAQQPLDLAAAYAVQRRLTALRTARGAARIGFKLGYTSQVMREQMGVDQPNQGPLLDTMRITDGRLPADLIHPGSSRRSRSCSARTCARWRRTPRSRSWTRYGGTTGSP